MTREATSSAENCPSQNSKTTAAVYAALEEANAFINANARQAADIYIRMTNEKRSGPADMERYIADPDNRWTTVPERSMQFAGFMNKVGTMKKLPKDWRAMFMPEAQALKGS